MSFAQKARERHVWLDIGFPPSGKVGRCNQNTIMHAGACPRKLGLSNMFRK